MNRNAELESRLNTIDRTFLTSVIRQMLNAPDADVIEWQVQLLAEVSAVGDLFRLTGTADVQSNTLNWSVIVKVISSPQRQNKPFQFLTDEPSNFGYWKREVLFYQSELLNMLPDGLSAPSCFHISEDRDSCWLWLEDVSKEDSPWSLARYGLAARQFGRFNGIYVVKCAVPDWPWFANDDGVSRWLIEQSAKSDTGWPSSETWLQIVDLCEKHPIIRRAWPDDTPSRLQRVWHEHEQFYRILRRLPKTLVHGDVSRKNLFSRGQKNSNEETVAIDWGLVGVAPIGQEISGLTVPSVYTLEVQAEQMDELDEIIFEAYLQGLCDVGWQGDPRVARLGYAARTAVHFAVMNSFPDSWVLAEETRAALEARAGMKAEEILEANGAMRCFIADRADETRRLVDALHL